MEEIARRIAVENGMPESVWELFMFDASKEFVAKVKGEHNAEKKEKAAT